MNPRESEILVKSVFSSVKSTQGRPSQGAEMEQNKDYDLLGSNSGTAGGYPPHA